MSQNCLQYLIRLVHFICDDIFDYSRYNNTSYYYDTASHPVKFGLIENNYMKQWQQCVKFGQLITADESRVAGWYHSLSTIGPYPKPIQPGAELHLLTNCVGERGAPPSSLVSITKIH